MLFRVAARLATAPQLGKSTAKPLPQKQIYKTPRVDSGRYSAIQRFNLQPVSALAFLDRTGDVIILSLTPSQGYDSSKQERQLAGANIYLLWLLVLICAQAVSPLLVGG